MSLDQILEQYARWRSVIDTHDKLIQEIASTKISLEKFLPKEISSLTEDHLAYQQETLQNLFLYTQKELKTEVSILRIKVRNLRTALDIYDIALNELSTMQQAFILLNRSNHFETEGAEFSKAEYEEEITRLQGSVGNTYEYLREFVGL